VAKAQKNGKGKAASKAEAKAHKAKHARKAAALAAERPKMPEPWAILIGPEGGFAPEELQRIRAVPGVVPISLGTRLLRADTAALAALAVWQAVMGG
jgi:16S rRNA (uracil1498-N3)-methyltransferase